MSTENQLHAKAIKTHRLVGWCRDWNPTLCAFEIYDIAKPNSILINQDFYVATERWEFKGLTVLPWFWDVLRKKIYSTPLFPPTNILCVFSNKNTAAICYDLQHVFKKMWWFYMTPMRWTRSFTHTGPRGWISARKGRNGREKGDTRGCSLKPVQQHFLLEASMSIYKPFICSYYNSSFLCLGSKLFHSNISVPLAVRDHTSPCFCLPHFAHCRCMSMPRKSISSTHSKVPPKISDSTCGLLGAYGSESEVNTGSWACFMELLSGNWFSMILYSSIQRSAKSVPTIC